MDYCTELIKEKKKMVKVLDMLVERVKCGCGKVCLNICVFLEAFAYRLLFSRWANSYFPYSLEISSSSSSGSERERARAKERERERERKEKRPFVQCDAEA